MVNYGNGKIYKIEPIVEHPEEDIYIGSTTKKYLSQRMDEHRSGYKKWKQGKINKFMVFNLFDKYGIDNCTILLIESVNANSKDELTAREGHYIKTLKCLNKKIEGRTKKEWYIDNIDKIKKQHKEYQIKNKETIKNAHAQICICNICNKSYTVGNKARHLKSKFCMDKNVDVDAN